MNRLPSFVSLFIMFAAGLVLTVGAVFVKMNHGYMAGNISVALVLAGLFLLTSSPLLIGLKFFIQLSSKR
jgi:CHASE2 domain-containing sensor protein